MKTYKFMDFCSGIGGGRIGLTKANMECVGHCEIDSVTNKTYEFFFPNCTNYGDLMRVDTKLLPNFDVMIAGFPCQTFSIVGKREGFSDDRGLVIYGLIKILIEKDLKYFIFENVKGLKSHDKGRTLGIILEELEKIGFNIYWKILKSSDYGVPQKRERLYLVGIKKEYDKHLFFFPPPRGKGNLKDFLCDETDLFNYNNSTFKKYLRNKYNCGKYSIDKLLSKENLIIDTRQSDLRLFDTNCPTLRKGRHGILYVKNHKMWKLTGYEALLLQGFPKEIAIKARESNIKNSNLLSQAGNAMTINVIEDIGKSLINAM